MRLLPLCLALAFLFGGEPARLLAHGRHAPPTAAEITWARTSAKWDKLRRDSRALLPPRPPDPDGVTDLDFPEFFGPIGDRGLDLRALDELKIRLVGFMVGQI